MLNYEKIGFNEIDNDTPNQVFYSYDLSSSELDTFLAYYVEDGEIVESEEIESIELCLTIFSKNDYKLEAVCSLKDSNENKVWITLFQQFNDANDLLNIIPPNERITLTIG